MSNHPETFDGELGRFAYDGLERAIHEKARLGILTCLMTRPDGLLFTELKELCTLSDGNLNRHLKVLQDEGLVELWKGRQERRPKTLCRITPQGRERFVKYLNVLEQVVADAAEAAADEPAAPMRRLREGWSPA